MALQHAVLGLLAEGPSHGYELKAHFEASIGPQWGELNIGHLYQILERLERDGLVTGRAIHQGDRPNKVVYRLTRRGREALQDWLGSPAPRPRGYRDDFFLKLFVASSLGPDTLTEVIALQREVYLAELSALARLRRKHRDDPLVGLLVEAALLHGKANLALVERAEERIPQLVEHQRQVVRSDPTAAAAQENRRARS